jgi:glycerophosphoryl diester phosphodiesterase
MKIENFKRVFFLVLAVVLCVTMTNTFYTKAVGNEVVTDGLVAWYDAENNTAAGHDADALVWEDLAGENDVAVTKNENSYFTADAFLTQNEEFNFPQEVLDTVNGTEFTVELEVGKVDILGTSFATLINSKGNDNFALFIRKTGAFLEFKSSQNARPKLENGESLLENSTIAITFKTNGLCVLYVDGIALSELDVKETCNASGPLFFGHTSSEKNHKTEYKSMRFYDRALSESEIQNNAKYNGTFNDSYVPDKSLVEFTQPSTKIIGDIMFSSIIENKAALDALEAAKETFMPANIIVYINKELKLTDKDGNNAYGDIADVFKVLDNKATPTFYIQDKETAQSLNEYIKSTGVFDINIMSSKPELVKAVREKNTAVRGAIDYTNTELDLKNTNKLLEIRKETNTNKSKIVMLAEEDITRDIVTYLTDRQMTVWVKAQAETTGEVSALTMAISGAHGIVCDDPANVYEILNKYFTSTTVTRAPQIIGHRGVPSLKPENTLEGAIEAYKQGADMIELDVYLTTDNVIVINHDAVTSHYNKHLQVENCTYAQLKELTYNGHDKIHMPTLEDFIKEFKGKDMILVIEIKSNKVAIIEPLKELIDKYDFYGQSYVITFENTNQLKYMQQYYPEMPVGFLTNSTYTGKSTLTNIIKTVGKYNSGYNPAYASYGASYIRASLFRGITTRPWTVNDKSSVYNCIFDGHAAITTDHCQWTGDMIEKITFDHVNVAQCYAGNKVQLSVQQQNHKREVSELEKNVKYHILSGQEYASIDGSELTFTAAGKVVLLAEYAQIIDGVYTFFSEPMTLTVYSDAIEAEFNAAKDTDNFFEKNIVLIVAAVVVIAAVTTYLVIMVKKKDH